MKQQKLSNMNETNRIEYKRELTPDLDIEKEVFAFLKLPAATTQPEKQE